MGRLTHQEILLICKWLLKVSGVKALLTQRQLRRSYTDYLTNMGTASIDVKVRMGYSNVSCVPQNCANSVVM